jgi:single-stranded DNA-binding protein
MKYIKTFENITYKDLKKGDAVMITGELKQSTYTDKEGKEKTSLEIVADQIGLLPRLVKSNKVSTDNEGAFPW